MRTYNEAFAAARQAPAFSNGSEGQCWMSKWCERCTNDDGDGCALVMVALNDRTPAEWTDEDKASLYDRYRCTEFRERREGDDDPKPAPAPPQLPGQVDMFEVFAEQITEKVGEVVPV